MNRLWWWIGIAGRTIIGLFIAVVVFIASIPFLASLPGEFVDVPKDQAMSQLGHYWQGINLPDDLERASGKTYSQIDCRVSWFKLKLSPASAKDLQDSIHDRLENTAQLVRGVEFIEGVHRDLSTPVPTRTQMGSAPNWWSPPSGLFRATERMRWYAGGTTYADAVYSAFDPSTNTLWVFDESRQHGQYWPRGSTPDGRQFSRGSAPPINHNGALGDQ